MKSQSPADLFPDNSTIIFLRLQGVFLYLKAFLSTLKVSQNMEIQFV